MLFLGIVAAGGVFAGTNPSYTQFELAHHYKTSETKFVIAEPELLPVVLGAASESHVPKSNIWIFNPTGQEAPDGFRSWTSLLEHGERDWVRFDDEKVSRSTIAARLFSSGTTGLPKAAAISHYNLVAQHIIVNEVDRAPYEVGIEEGFLISEMGFLLTDGHVVFLLGSTSDISADVSCRDGAIGPHCGSQGRRCQLCPSAFRPGTLSLEYSHSQD